MTLRKISATAVGALAVLALASCGSDSKSDSGGDKPAGTTPSEVDLTVDAGPGIKFGETSYTVAAGDVEVALVNRDSQRHTLDIVDADNTVIGSELVVGKSGDSDTGTFPLQPGEYEIVCLVPGHEAMKSTLTVTG
jgi:plastocyanin